MPLNFKPSMSIECTELNLLQAPEETIAGMVISLNTIRSINFTAVIILAGVPLADFTTVLQRCHAVLIVTGYIFSFGVTVICVSP